MKLEVEPEQIGFKDPAPRGGMCLVTFCGVVVPGLYRTPETGAGRLTQLDYLARIISERVERMSNHERLEFKRQVALNFRSLDELDQKDGLL
ncbi:hypothetical protein [Leisingera sp. ANG-S3]|uniref:hypothetical protein n=1 Tax=Leisingera sp. ANG-S3 TaxID=1577899 RepID=UPI001269EDAA|nr:hypothetical protein [Leisingera sp. ANG-S3]